MSKETLLLCSVAHPTRAAEIFLIASFFVRVGVARNFFAARENRKVQLESWEMCAEARHCMLQIIPSRTNSGLLLLLLVVLPPFGRIDQVLVGFLQAGEVLLRGVRVQRCFVRVVFQHQLPVRFFDFLFAGGAGDAQTRVKIRRLQVKMNLGHASSLLLIFFVAAAALLLPAEGEESGIVPSLWVKIGPLVLRR